MWWEPTWITLVTLTASAGHSLASARLDLGTVLPNWICMHARWYPERYASLTNLSLGQRMRTSSPSWPSSPCLPAPPGPHTTRLDRQQGTWATTSSTPPRATSSRPRILSPGMCWSCSSIRGTLLVVLRVRSTRTLAILLYLCQNLQKICAALNCRVPFIQLILQPQPRCQRRHIRQRHHIHLEHSQRARHCHRQECQLQ